MAYVISRSSRLVAGFCVILACMTSPLLGDEVSVGVAFPRVVGCALRDVISVTLYRPGQPDLVLSLERNDVVVSSNRVFLAQDGDGDVILQSVETATEAPTRGSYHNHRQGASLVLTCVMTSNGQVPRVQGSVYLKDAKHRLEPSDDWLDTVTFTFTHVMAKYSLRPLPEVLHTHDYIFHPDVLPTPPITMTSVPDRVMSPRHRGKRQTKTYTVDVLPVIDYALYSRWFQENGKDDKKAVGFGQSYLADVYTSVAMRIKTLNIPDTTLEVRMVEPVMLKTASSAEFVESIKVTTDGKEYTVAAPALLGNFSEWVTRNTTILPEHDHAMLFTGYELTGADNGQRFNITKGLAYVGTICERGKSTSVIDDLGAYQSEGPAAHELGHSLGSLHDGEQNDCRSPSRYVMSDGTYESTDANKYNPWSFSRCSSDYITQTLEKVAADPSLASCLTTSDGEVPNETIPKLPNDQCKAYNGPESFTCRGTGLPSLEQVCDGILCRQAGSAFICNQLSTASGTCCGNGKMCKAGRCQAAESGQCVMDEACPLGDQPGIILDGYTCEQLPSTYCYLKDVSEKCCVSCPTKKTNKTGCEYGDKRLGCDASNCTNKFANGLEYSFICCDTCPGGDCLNTQNLNYNDQIYPCQEFISTFGRAWCYEANVHNEACCQTCEAVRDTENSDCPYGDKSHRYNCQFLTTQGKSNCTSEEELNCCETCAKIEAGLATTQPPATTADPNDNSSGGGTTSSNGGTDSGQGQTNAPATDPIPTTAPAGTRPPRETLPPRSCRFPPCSGCRLQSPIVLLFATSLAALLLPHHRRVWGCSLPL